jgi:hypothetical protein
MLRRNFLGALLAPLVPIQTGVEIKSPLTRFLDQQLELRKKAKKNSVLVPKVMNNGFSGAYASTTQHTALTWLARRAA